MKKYITIFVSLLFLTIQSVKADLAIGLTGALHSFDVSGTETTRQSSQKNTGSHSDEVGVAELFIEASNDDGLAVGIAYIPTRDMGSKSRTDTNSDGDTGTYKAEAELDNVIQAYADIPFVDVMGSKVYLKVGIQHADVVTLESLNSGETYPNKSVMGYSVGLGAKGDVPYGSNMFYKLDLVYTDFGDYKATGTADNRVEAELEDVAAKFSVGYKF